MNLYGGGCVESARGDENEVSLDIHGIYIFNGNLNLKFIIY